jgi:hypothetical protein
MKIGIRYEYEKNNTKGYASIKYTNPSENENEKKPKSYANILKGSTNSESNSRKGNDGAKKPDYFHKNNKNEFRRVVPP